MLHPVHLVTGGESCSKGTTYSANYNPTITRSVHTTAAIFVGKSYVNVFSFMLFQAQKSLLLVMPCRLWQVYEY